MCGIAGFVHRDATLADEATLARLGNLQAHRGPDHFGTAVRGSAGFAHNRLSILDPTEAGHQPFTDDHHVLCYNGEIYNYLDFRSELSFEGVELRSHCDTEVLFHMLVRYGVPETLARIQGMFAFSFYDCRQQRLFLCRDRLGIKPLHWYDNGTTIYWASESKTLALGLDLNPDPVKTLFSLGLNGESFWEQTLFEGVRQVPPGCYLTFSPESGPEVVEYFHATDWVDREMFGELDRADSQSIVDEFARLFRQSVRRMLMSDVPMGAFVSGGIDSSLITSVAADHDDHLQLFTADVAGPMSEFTAAFQLADSTGCELHSFTFEPDMMLRDWSETTYYYECPIVSFPNAIPFANVAKLARRHHVKPVLTGEGSDELFLGYPFLCYQKYFDLLRAPARLTQSVTAATHKLRERLYPELHKNLAQFISDLNEGYSHAENRSRASEAFGFLGRRNRVKQCLTLEMATGYPLVGLLHRNDRMGMMASIESRFPFLGDELMRFAINLPHRWKLRRTWRVHDRKHPFLVDKFVVRQLAQRTLPAALAKQRKWDFKMAAHSHLAVRSEFFHGGYLQQILRLTHRDLAQMVEREHPEFVARAVSVDLFGRLFALRERSEDIAERLQQFVTLQPHSIPYHPPRRPASPINLGRS